jgi:hypothetical protein
MRSAVRKAERDFNRDLATAERRAERDLNRQLTAAQSEVQREVGAETRRLQRRLDTQAGGSRPVTYTATERLYLDAIRDTVVEDEVDESRERDLFLCHAWADRQHAARELFEALVELNVDAWFSEEDVALGANLPRQLDRGISCSRVGVVLVTPAMLMALRQGGFADQELGALLLTGRVIPVLHGVTYEELRRVSPLLATRAGLTTTDSSLTDVAEKIADGVLLA